MPGTPEIYLPADMRVNKSSQIIAHLEPYRDVNFNAMHKISQ